jgi:GntR family transcriptional regulator
LTHPNAAPLDTPERGDQDMISLNYRDARPIYEQIKDELRKLIVTGAMSADDKLPSVRSLAAQLAINPNTIQRAYNELETEGYIYSVPGKGSFASANAGKDSSRRQELLKKVRELLRELRYLGVTQTELQALLKEENGDDRG